MLKNRTGRDHPTEDMGSTVPRRQLGRMLRQLRTEAGVTLDGVAEALECSRQKVWRIESGLGSVRSLDVKAMCQLYDVTPELVAALVGLAGETKAKGWWHAYGDAIPEWFELYVGLEAAASRLRFFKDTLVPGLLQSRDYALGMYRIDQPEMSEEDRERAVEVRLQRQSSAHPSPAVRTPAGGDPLRGGPAPAGRRPAGDGRSTPAPARTVSELPERLDPGPAPRGRAAPRHRGGRRSSCSTFRPATGRPRNRPSSTASR